MNEVGDPDTGFITEKDRVLRLEQELAIASQKAERVLVQEEKYGDALGRAVLSLEFNFNSHHIHQPTFTRLFHRSPPVKVETKNKHAFYLLLHP